MTLSLVLWLVLGGFAVLLCLWAAATAALRVDEHDTVHRGWTFLAGTLLPPAMLAVAFAAGMDRTLLTAATAALPVLVIAGTWSNVMTLKDQVLVLKLLHLPVLAFNAALAGIYGVRALQELCGIDLGTWGTTITTGHALLQVWIGQQGAETNPMWLHLPFLLPLWLRYQWQHKLALLLACLMAVAMGSLLVMGMPLAYIKAQSYREAPIEPSKDEPLKELPATLPVGVKVPWGERMMTEQRLGEWRSHLAGLAVDHVAVEVGPELFADEPLLLQVKREIGMARQRGLAIVVVAQPPLQFGTIPARDLNELAHTMLVVQQQAAKQLEPDLLVLFSGPFGRLSDLLAKNGTLEQWKEVIVEAATRARAARPTMRLSVAIEHQALHAYELFRWLKANESPVEVVGLALYPGSRTMEEVQAMLATAERWCRRTPGDRPTYVVETGACPYTCGGELGQWNFLRTLLAVACRAAPQGGVCIDSLIDGTAAQGLVSRTDHQRYAYWQLDYMLRHRTPAVPVAPVAPK